MMLSTIFWVIGGKNRKTLLLSNVGTDLSDGIRYAKIIPILPIVIRLHQTSYKLSIIGYRTSIGLLRR